MLFQDKNTDKLRSLREPSGRRLANFVRSQASLPKTTKDKPAYCCTPIIDGKKIYSRSPKCYLRRSQACDPKDSKNNPMVQAQAPSQQGAQSGPQGRPPQLVNVGLESSNKAEAARLVKASSKPTSLAFLIGTTILPRRSLRFLGGTSGKWNRKNQLAEIKFYCTGVYICLWKLAVNGCF